MQTSIAPMAWAALCEKAEIGHFPPEITNNAWNQYVRAAPPLSRELPDATYRPESAQQSRSWPRTVPDQLAKYRPTPVLRSATCLVPLMARISRHAGPRTIRSVPLSWSGRRLWRPRNPAAICASSEGHRRRSRHRDGQDDLYKNADLPGTDNARSCRIPRVRVDQSG
jgi:hypothetical protein